MVFVPDRGGGGSFTDADATDGQAALQRAGLVLGPVRTLLDPACISIGRVLSQDPAPRATALAGSAVAIWTGRRDPSHPCRP